MVSLNIRWSHWRPMWVPVASIVVLGICWSSRWPMPIAFLTPRVPFSIRSIIRVGWSCWWPMPISFLLPVGPRLGSLPVGHGISVNVALHLWHLTFPWPAVVPIELLPFMLRGAHKIPMGILRPVTCLVIIPVVMRSVPSRGAAFSTCRIAHGLKIVHAIIISLKPPVHDVFVLNDTVAAV